jgi:N-acetylmuramoyl-L-alanine amidase
VVAQKTSAFCKNQSEKLPAAFNFHGSIQTSRGKCLSVELEFDRILGMPRTIRHTLALVIPFLLGACATAPITTETKDTSKTFKTVVVDAGHGGKDLGASRRYGGSEKNATLDVAKRVAEKLRESQLKIVMTRSSDEFISLDQRVEIQNAQKNSIFVSIHFNDSRRRGAHGYETYYNSPQARGLAERIQGKLMTIPHSANRGVKPGRYHVLRFSNYPAILVECGFLSNRREGGEARDSEYRELLADRIAEAIVEQRFGAGVYRASAQAGVKPPAEGPSNSGPGLAPSSLRHD